MKQIINALTLVSLLTLGINASAEEINVKLKARASTTPAQIRLDMRVGVDARTASSTERRAEMESRKASSTQRRVEMQQSLARKQAVRAARVFSATIGHLENILERVESRIAKVKVGGSTTPESEAHVADVKVHLSEAKSALTAFTSIQITSDKASENFEAVREAGKEVKEHLKEAHQSLMKAIRSLKSGRTDKDKKATTTNATTTSS